MSKTYERADEQTIATVEATMARHHKRLTAEGLRLDVLMVSETDDDSGDTVPALKHQGYPAAAVIKITPLKERALGNGDALLVVDAYTWKNAGAHHRAALIDHELTHLELAHDEDGVLKRDDLGRPRLKIRLHDYQLGGFREVIARHGVWSFEVAQVQACKDCETGQYYWDFGAPARAAAD